MNAPLPTDPVSPGYGFAFFHWHVGTYGSDDWLFPHPAREQQLCRESFTRLNPLEKASG